MAMPPTQGVALGCRISCLSGPRKDGLDGLSSSYLPLPQEPAFAEEVLQAVDAGADGKFVGGQDQVRAGGGLVGGGDAGEVGDLAAVGQGVQAASVALAADFHGGRQVHVQEALLPDGPAGQLAGLGVGAQQRADGDDSGVIEQPGGYENFDFEVPVAQRSDCYNRTVLRVEEMRQSVRIVEQCLAHMPGGNYKSDHPLAGPPRKEKTMHDIETLITHFLSVTWGPVIPCGEAHAAIEAPKGVNGYYVVSDGGTASYRTRIRTPSFAHLQMTPTLCRGAMLADLFAILGAVDFVLADVDR